MDPPDDKKKKKKWDDDDEDEGSEVLSIRPRNLSYSLQSARALKSPAKRKKKPAWPPRGEDDEEEEGEDNGDEDDDDDDTGSRHSYEGNEMSINHANLYKWLHKWTKEYGIPAVTPIMGVFSTRCLDGTWRHG